MSTWTDPPCQRRRRAFRSRAGTALVRTVDAAPTDLSSPRAVHPLTRLARLAALPLLVAGMTGPVRAEADEWALHVGPGLTGLSERPLAADGDEASLRLGLGLTTGLRYGLSDFWQLGASLDAHLAVEDAAFLGALYAELHYVIDIVTWVPFLTLGVGARLRDQTPSASGPELRVDLAVTLGGGIEYRPDRDFAFGLEGRYELIPTDFSRAHGFTVALRYTRFFE